MQIKRKKKDFLAAQNTKKRGGPNWMPHAGTEAIAVWERISKVCLSSANVFKCYLVYYNSLSLYLDLEEEVDYESIVSCAAKILYTPLHVWLIKWGHSDKQFDVTKSHRFKKKKKKKEHVQQVFHFVHIDGGH